MFPYYPDWVPFNGLPSLNIFFKKYEWYLDGGISVTVGTIFKIYQPEGVSDLVRPYLSSFLCPM